MESDNFQYEREMKWDNAGEGIVRQILFEGSAQLAHDFFADAKADAVAFNLSGVF